MHLTNVYAVLPLQLTVDCKIFIIFFMFTFFVGT